MNYGRTSKLVVQFNQYQLIQIMTSFLENINLPHPKSKVMFGSLTIIPNKGEDPICMDEIPTELLYSLHTKKSRKFGSIERANRSKICPVDDDDFQFNDVPLVVTCCVVS